jgi:hypothetical protein
MPCQNCRSWEPAVGECRHNPPTVVIDAGGKRTRAFPPTGPDDWCATGYTAKLAGSTSAPGKLPPVELKLPDGLLPKDRVAPESADGLGGKLPPRRPPLVVPTKK